MCIAIAVPSDQPPIRLARLVEYFDPRQKEIVFDLFCEIPGDGPRCLTMLHRGKVNVSLEAASLFGGKAKSSFVSFIAQRSEQMHGHGGWLGYKREGERIVFENQGCEIGDEPSSNRCSLQYVEPHPCLKLMTSEHPPTEHRPFTIWEIGSLPRSPFALRIHVAMTEGTSRALTGSSIGESPEFFWIYGGSLLLDAVEGELAGARNTLFTEFRSMQRVTPELFEYIETFSDEIDKNYTAYPLSLNTVRQPVPQGLDGSTNWFVLTPYDDGPSDDEISPYDQLEIRFDTVVRS
jgi:hypothetical protein